MACNGSVHRSLLSLVGTCAPSGQSTIGRWSPHDAIPQAQPPQQPSYSGGVPVTQHRLAMPGTPTRFTPKAAYRTPLHGCNSATPPSRRHMQVITEQWQDCVLTPTRPGSCGSLTCRQGRASPARWDVEHAVGLATGLGGPSSPATSPTSPAAGSRHSIPSNIRRCADRLAAGYRTMAGADGRRH